MFFFSNPFLTLTPWPTRGAACHFSNFLRKFYLILLVILAIWLKIQSNGHFQNFPVISLLLYVDLGDRWLTALIIMSKSLDEWKSNEKICKEFLLLPSNPALIFFLLFPLLSLPLPPIWFHIPWKKRPTTFPPSIKNQLQKKSSR